MCNCGCNCKRDQRPISNQTIDAIVSRAIQVIFNTNNGGGQRAAVEMAVRQALQIVDARVD